MKRYKDNLERLAQKLQARYGEHDPLVLEVKHELARLELDHSNILACAFVTSEPSISHEKESNSLQAKPGD